MKTVLGCVAIFAAIYAPAAQAADCATLQQYWGEFSNAQSADNDFNYVGKTSEAEQQYQRCINNIWRIYGSSGSDAAAQAARDCEDEKNYTLMNIEDEYWLIHNEAIITSIAYYDYLNQTLAEGLQCF